MKQGGHVQDRGLLQGEGRVMKTDRGACRETESLAERGTNRITSYVPAGRIDEDRVALWGR